ncbi:hypothetical protein BCR32DRAFT_290929 [Anaeromyces robustus]|uniref:Uncharacterized protein n=1 Tax=Anaeromyces robustus TaxID=1754192 RepID=A0A1Y1XH73_9FUNG|nr:hypothetical protein BCR32DRAFT_290929 [Anaeromyces robustus]|eukprot:ORX85073.1 hypothetical protein BCR32DRAFT_290929 [Anaeromyces robustus]
MLSDKELLILESQRHYFIEHDRDKASYLDWLKSRGTNFDCYKEYLNSINNENKIDSKIDTIRTIIYALFCPFKGLFFYWTLIICILHKFNFKKPVMKIIIAHYVLGILGDIFDKLGDLFQHYYANTYIDDLRIDTKCINTLSIETAHPFKFFLKRQVATIFWYSAGIFGDWYPLIRTKAVIKEKKMLTPVYITCGLFNLSKIVLIIHHWTLLPNQLYDENGVFIMENRDNFYMYHWLLQFIIICTSLLYDISVYYVLKKNFFPVNDSDFGFLKKFKTTSEYRILISAFISIFLLPLAAISILLKFYFMMTQRVKHAEFSYEDIRLSIINLQYHMIFIDQILLFQSNKEHSNMLSAVSGRRKKSTKSKFNSKKKYSKKNKSHNGYSQNNSINGYSLNNSIREYSQNNSIHGYSQNNSIHGYSQTNSVNIHSQINSVHGYSQTNSNHRYSQNDNIYGFNQNDYLAEYDHNDFINKYNQTNSLPKLRLTRSSSETSFNKLIEYD